jgi:hypothetical protein
MGLARIKENTVRPLRRLLMSESNSKTSGTFPEDDLSFPPPLTEQGQYLLLANQFLAQDQAIQEIFGAHSGHQPARKRGARTRIFD